MSSKINLFQNLGTILALVISALALFVSVYEASLLKTQQKAVVWPYLALSTNYNGDGFSFMANNNGIGPALIKSMEIKYKGEPVKDYNDLLNKIKPDRVIGYDRLRMGRLNKSVMKAGEERLLFAMPWDNETREIVEDLTNISITIHYCSVLEECWVYNYVTDEYSKGTFKAKVEFNN